MALTERSSTAQAELRAALQPNTAPYDAFEVLRLACWFGLLAGLCELLGRWLLARYFDRVFLYVSHPHAAWMTLAATLVLFGALGSLLAILRRFAPRLAPAWLVTGLLALLFVYALGDVIVVEGLMASVMLSLGVACAAARGRHKLLALARRTVWLLAGASLLVGGGALVGAAIKERRPTAPHKSDAPNVLLITLDTVRAQDLSLYGYHRRTTPRLEQFAKRGVCFDQAISTVSWTLPSHASLFTGHYPQDVFHGVPRTFMDAWEAPMDGALPTLAEYLSRQGYRTAGFVANWEFGDRVFGLQRGFAHYQEYEIGIEQTLKSAFATRMVAEGYGKAMGKRSVLARKDGGTVNAEFLGWLNHNAGQPFFAFLNYMDVHDPYEPPPAFAGRFTPADEEHSPGESATGPRAPAAARLRSVYDCCLAALDDHIGRLLDELERRGILANTLVVITSDHGEHFGEHGRFNHGDTLYMPVIHVPLVVVCPNRVPEGVRVGGPASLRDVSATVTDLLDVGTQSPLRGTSLRRRWENPALPGEPAYSNLDMMARLTDSTRPVRLRSLVTDRYHYIEAVDTSFHELYDLQRDPLEEKSLVDVPEAASIIEQLRAKFPSR